MVDREQAKGWLDRMSSDEAINILLEHYKLKQHLCAQRLGILTGSDDWIDKAIVRATNLRECDRQLSRLISGCAELIANAKWRARETVCFNCNGKELIGGKPCVICGGTGACSF